MKVWAITTDDDSKITDGMITAELMRRREFKRVVCMPITEMTIGELVDAQLDRNGLNTAFNILCSLVPSIIVNPHDPVDTARQVVDAVRKERQRAVHFAETP